MRYSINSGSLFWEFTCADAIGAIIGITATAIIFFGFYIFLTITAVVILWKIVIPMSYSINSGSLFWEFTSADKITAIIRINATAIIFFGCFVFITITTVVILWKTVTSMSYIINFSSSLRELPSAYVAATILRRTAWLMRCIIYLRPSLRRLIS